MREEASCIGNVCQEGPSNKYDTFSSKEKEAIVQRVKGAAIIMGKLSGNRQEDWKEVVLGLKCDIWKTFVRKIIPKFVSFSSVVLFLTPIDRDLTLISQIMLR